MSEEKAKFVEYKRISTKLLKHCPLNPRSDYGNLEELTDTIIQDGILADLVVRPKDGHYEVICGERRRLALQNADISEAPCKVYEMSDSVARRWMAIEDYQKEIWRPYERGKFYIEWIKSENLTTEDLAAIVGCSRSKIKDYTSFAKGIDEEVGKKVAAATKEGESESKTLSFRKARRLTILERGVQKALASKILTEGMSENEVAKSVQNIKEIQADISKCSDEKLKDEAKKTFLKPETLVKTDPIDVKRFLGLPLKEEDDWLSFSKFSKKFKDYCGKIPEVAKIEENKEEGWIKIFYKKTEK